MTRHPASLATRRSAIVSQEAAGVLPWRAPRFSCRDDPSPWAIRLDDEADSSSFGSARSVTAAKVPSSTVTDLNVGGSVLVDRLGHFEKDHLPSQAEAH